MKKLMCVFFTFAALLMLAVPALAVGSESILDLDAAPGGTESTSAPMADVPVGESTCREETPAPYEPPVRLPGQGEIDDILSYWEENGYPSDVSYAFEAGDEVVEDGTVRAWWEIGLVDANEARRQEILRLVSPACLVEFRTCQFTHAQKQAAYGKLTELAADDPNILEVIFIRNGDTVWVAVPEEKTKEYAKYLIRDLDLGAVVSVTDQHSIASFEDGLAHHIGTPGGGLDAAGIQSVPPITGGLVPTAPAHTPSPLFWVCLTLAVFVACTLTVPALRRRFALAAVTTHGEIRTPGAPLTRRQAEQAVKDGAETPDSALFRAIVERIKDSPKQ